MEPSLGIYAGEEDKYTARRENMDLQNGLEDLPLSQGHMVVFPSLLDRNHAPNISFFASVPLQIPFCTYHCSIGSISFQYSCNCLLVFVKIFKIFCHVRPCYSRFFLSFFTYYIFLINCACQSTTEAYVF